MRARSLLIRVAAIVVAVAPLSTPSTASASFPGANGDIVYAGFDGGDDEIYRVNVDGLGLDALTSNDESDETPAFSPDGTRIAFQRESAIWVMDADGGSQSRLTFSGSYSKPVWSPDGTRIAMAIGGSSGLAVMDADGSNIVELTAAGTNSDDPSWSPDGMWIAYWSVRGGTADLYAIHPDGTGEIQLTSRRPDDYGPSWSPDGSMIAFSRFGAKSPNGDIHVISVDGTVHERLTRRDPYDVNPVWSPDGTMIAWERCGAGSAIVVMGIDGSNKTPVTSAFTGCTGAYPDWQPVP